jgi:prophage protein|nr:MAG TPA: Head decoration protein [Caudoviricetes sp.]
MKVEKGTLVRDNINFLASDKYVAFTYTVPQSKGTLIEGRKIVKAGTILPENNATAKGILLEDVDVTAGDNVGSLLEDGFVLKDRLPVAPETTAITALKRITFK